MSQDHLRFQIEQILCKEGPLWKAHPALLGRKKHVWQNADLRLQCLLWQHACHALSPPHPFRLSTSAPRKKRRSVLLDEDETDEEFDDHEDDFEMNAWTLSAQDKGRYILQFRLSMIPIRVLPKKMIDQYLAHLLIRTMINIPLVFI